jgi:uncharacterized membrane protein YkvI
MNCHGNHDHNSNENGKQNSHKGHLPHMLMMALCCGAPVLLLLLVPLLAKTGSGGLAKIFTAVAPFLCPLMMVFMIPMMFKGSKDKTDKNCCKQNEKLPLNEKTQEDNS